MSRGCPWTCHWFTTVLSLENFCRHSSVQAENVLQVLWFLGCEWHSHSLVASQFDLWPNVPKGLSFADVLVFVTYILWIEVIVDIFTWLWQIKDWKRASQMVNWNFHKSVTRYLEKGVWLLLGHVCDMFRCEWNKCITIDCETSLSDRWSFVLTNLPLPQRVKPSAMLYKFASCCERLVREQAALENGITGTIS